MNCSVLETTQAQGLKYKSFHCQEGVCYPWMLWIPLAWIPALPFVLAGGEEKKLG